MFSEDGIDTLSSFYSSQDIATCFCSMLGSVLGACLGPGLRSPPAPPSFCPCLSVRLSVSPLLSLSLLPASLSLYLPLSSLAPTLPLLLSAPLCLSPILITLHLFSPNTHTTSHRAVSRISERFLKPAFPSMVPLDTGPLDSQESLEELMRIQMPVPLPPGKSRVEHSNYNFQSSC